MRVGSGACGDLRCPATLFGRGGSCAPHGRTSSNIRTGVPSPAAYALTRGSPVTALRLFRTLPATAGRAVRLSTALQAGNVLAAEREPWLVIDPKPYVGDPTYDPLQHMLNCDERLGADPRGLAHRMADLLGPDRERLLLWLFARCVQESPDRPELADVARRIVSLAVRACPVSAKLVASPEDAYRWTEDRAMTATRRFTVTVIAHSRGLRLRAGAMRLSRGRGSKDHPSRRGLPSTACASVVSSNRSIPDWASSSATPGG
ncbi:MAG: aminoglycoside phosphotransferase family protein [Egibacteraceae bacterium]